nr:rhodanese-like domain-containing protein [uncultured Bacillus sp.]
MKKIGFALLLVSVMLLASCGSVNSGSEGNDAKLYEDVSVKQAKELIDNDEVVVIDVRTQEEFNEGHIPNARLIPVDEIDNKMEDLDKDTSYLIVCRSGNRSATASKLLAKNGFNNMKNMKGGMNAWTYDVKK